MRIVRVPWLCALLLAAALPLSAQDAVPAADEKAVRDLASDFVQRWNARDGAGVAALFDPANGTVRVGSQPAVRGADAIAAWVKAYPATEFKRLDARPRQAHVFNPVLAGVDLVREGTAPEAAERALPAWELTLQRGGAGWRVLRMRQVAAGTTAVAYVGGSIQEPRKLKNVPPAYPDEAKQARVQGAVILECTVSPQGQVTDVEVLSGPPLLVEPAIAAVKQWEYTPTLLNGVAVPVILTVTVNFRLR